MMEKAWDAPGREGVETGLDVRKEIWFDGRLGRKGRTKELEVVITVSLWVGLLAMERRYVKLIQILKDLN